MYHMDIPAAVLADAAVVEGGKLYIHGAGWDVISASSFPASHPSMALAFIVRVEYSEALTDLMLFIELLDDDGNPMMNTIEGKLNVGHPAGSLRGHPILVPQALTFRLLKFEKPGVFTFRISTGDAELHRGQFRVVQT
jgi:hypothetical protein